MLAFFNADQTHFQVLWDPVIGEAMTRIASIKIIDSTGKPI